jgi:hypothetical protein
MQMPAPQPKNNNQRGSNNQLTECSPKIVNKNLLKTMESAFKVKNKITDAVAGVLGPAKNSPRKQPNSTLLKGSTV